VRSDAQILVRAKKLTSQAWETDGSRGAHVISTPSVERPCATP
jgi:hypothetical protein